MSREHTFPPHEHVPTLTLTDDRKWYTVRCSCDWGTARYPAPVNDEWKRSYWEHVGRDLFEERRQLREAMRQMLCDMATCEESAHPCIAWQHGAGRKAAEAMGVAI